MKSIFFVKTYIFIYALALAAAVAVIPGDSYGAAAKKAGNDKTPKAGTAEVLVSRAAGTGEAETGEVQAGESEKAGTGEVSALKKFYTASFTSEKRKEFQKLINDYRKDRKKAGPSYSLYVMGLVRELAGEFEAAVKNYEKLIDLYPKTKYAGLSKERISECYLALGNKEKAISNYLDYYKWRVSEGKREDILFKIAGVYNQTLTTFDGLMEAYRQAAKRYEYSHGKTIEYLVGYFKGFHLLDAHMATFYYRQMLKEYPDGLHKFDALLNMSIVFAYDLSDIDSAKKMLDRLLSEKSEFAGDYRKTQRLGAFVMGLLTQFHSPQNATAQAPNYYKKIIFSDVKDELTTMSAYYLGYYYEHYSVELNKKPVKSNFNKKSTIDNYMGEIMNDAMRKPVDNAISSYMVGFLTKKDDFYAEECAYRASLLLINTYSDTATVTLLYKSLKKVLPEIRRGRDFEDLINLKMPASFDQKFSALYSKEKKLYESSQFKKAIETHEEIIAKSGTGPEAEYSQFTIGRIYEEDIKDYESAIAAYKRFLEKFPKSGRYDKVLYQIAKINEVNLLDLNEAVKYYNKLIDEGKDQLWIFQGGVDLAALYSKPVFKKESEAPKILEKLRDKVPMREDEILFKLGEIYEKTSKKPEKTAELYEKIVREYPGSIYFENALDKVLGAYYKENLEELKKQAVLAQDEGPEELAKVLNEKYEKEKFIGDYKAALETLREMKNVTEGSEEIVLIDMRSAELQIDGLNETEKGIAALRTLAKEAEGTNAQADVFYSLGKVLEEREKDYKSAVEIYEKAIAMDAVHSKAQMMSMFKAGLVYAINLKDYENAFRCYSLIMAKYPDEAREEKLDAKISNILNIDPALLQSYLKSAEMMTKKSGDTSSVELEGGKSGDTSEAGTKKSGPASWLKNAYENPGSLVPGMFKTGGSEGLIDEEDDSASWFSKASRPSYGEVSWFKKSAAGNVEYSWFQKPVDLSDIGIGEPTWFKKGALSVERFDGIDEETAQLRAQMALPPVKTSRTNKYLAYIEAHPDSPKLPVIYLYLGIAYEESNDFEKAIETYRKILLDFKGYQGLSFTACERLCTVMARDRKEYSKASFLAGKMKEQLPKYFNQFAKIDEKIKNYQKIDQNDIYIKEHIGDEKSLDLMYENAKIYEEKLKDYDSAITYLNKCTAYISGDSEEVKYKLDIVRICEESKNDYKLAVEELTDILERFPGRADEDALNYKAAELLIKKLNEKEKGVKLLEKVMARKKNDKNFKEAMTLLHESYSQDKVAEKAEVAKTLKTMTPELKLSPDIEKAFKKSEVEKKAKDLLDIIDHDPENPTNFRYMYYVARLYEREAEDFENAAKYYRKLIDMNIPDESLIQGITSLGIIYETKIKKPELAIKLYREFIVKNVPQDIDFLAYLQFKIGECYELLRKKDDCIEAYRKVKFYYPISRWAKTAETRVDQIISSPGKFVSLYEKRKPDYEEEETGEVAAKPAKGTFEVALETGEISLSSAEIEIAGEKDPEKKIEKLQALIDTRPEKDPKLPKYLIELARLYNQTKKQDRAAEALKRIIEEFPKYERYYDVALELAEMYRVANNFEEAARYYKQIVQESPQYDKTEYVRYMLGRMYIEKREYMYAIDTFQELTDRYQDSVYAKAAMYEKGLVRERYLKDYDAAILDFQTMVSRYFDHENAPDAQFEIGWIYENVKYDLPKAREAYQTILDRFPNTPRRREIMDIIERINSKMPK